MKKYRCEYCNLSTHFSADYKKHLLTKKHLRNTKEMALKSQKEPQKSQKEPQKSQKEPKKSQQISKNTKSESLFYCDHCNKTFKTFSNKRRHELHRCKQNKSPKTEKIYSELVSIKKEKKRLYKQIEKLIDKAGDTTITNNNNSKNINIKLNGYGKEDLSYITDSFKTQLLHGPYGMIQKMIEQVHFNPEFPENKNIALTNKKENRIKIFSGAKWIYKDKSDTINDLLDGKYFILDTHYENVCDKITGRTKSIYEQFRQFFDEKDDELHEKLKKECELTLLNNR